MLRGITEHSRFPRVILCLVFIEAVPFVFRQLAQRIDAADVENDIADICRKIVVLEVLKE